MSLRDIMRSSPGVGIAVVAVLLLAAIFTLLRSGPAAPEGGLWYYDLATAQRVQGGTQPPSPSAVTARVFSCGECTDETFIGYLEKPNPNPPASVPGEPLNPAIHTLVAAVPEQGDEATWIVGSAADSNAITNLPAQRCGKRYHECLP